MTFIEDFDDYYDKCDVSFESPWWNNFGDAFPEPCQTNREIKRSGRYSLEFGFNSDAGIVIPVNPDSAYYIEFYFRNSRGELGIELLQDSNGGETLVVNSRIGLFGDNLGIFDTGGEDGQFFFIPFEWNHARIILDMPSGSGQVFINDTKIGEWNWFYQLDGSSNMNPFRGMRFNNQADTGTGLIDDLYVGFSKATGISNVSINKPDVIYSAFDHELIIKDNGSQIMSLELIDLRGRKLITFAHRGEQKIRLDNNIPNGVFIIRMKLMDGRIYAEKLSIQR
jgi:hypothetical protein